MGNFVRVGGSVQASLAQLSRSFTLFSALSVAALGAFAAATTPLENAMARLESVTQPQFRSMQMAMRESLESAREFSSTFIYSTTEMIDASYELASAGLNVEQTMAAINSSANLAAGTLGNLRQTTMIMGQAINTVGQSLEMQFMSPMEKAEKIADSMSLTVKKFQLTLPVLAEGFKYTAGQASLLGIGVDELNIALGILNTAGIRGSLAGTSLANAFNRMAKARNKLNLNADEFTDATGKVRSFASFLEAVDKALPVNRFERFSKITEVFGVRAAKGVLVLLKNLDALRANTREYEGATGASKMLANIVTNTLTGAWQKFSNNIKNLVQRIGQDLLPALKSTLLGLSQFVKTISPAIVFLVKFGSTAVITKAAILLMSGVFTKITAIIAAYTAATTTATAATAGLGAATTTAFGAITAFVTAIGGVGTVVAVITGLTIALESLFSTTNKVSGNLSKVPLEMQRMVDQGDALIDLFGRLDQAFAEGTDFKIQRGDKIAISDFIDFAETRGVDLALSQLKERFQDFKTDVKIKPSIDAKDLSFRDVINVFSAFTPPPIEIKALGVDGFVKEVKRSEQAVNALVESFSKMDRVARAQKIIDVWKTSLKSINASFEKSNPLIDRAIKELEEYNTTAEEGVDIIKAFNNAYKDALKSAGITIPANQFKEFIGTFNAISKDIEGLAQLEAKINVRLEKSRQAQLLLKGGLLPTTSVVLATDDAQERMRKLYQFITNNFPSLEKMSSEWAEGFEKNFKTVEGNWVDFNQIVKRSGDRVEELGFKTKYLDPILSKIGLASQSTKGWQDNAVVLAQQLEKLLPVLGDVDAQSRKTAAVFAKMAKIDLDLKRFESELTSLKNRADAFSEALTGDAESKKPLAALRSQLSIHTDIVSKLNQAIERTRELKNRALTVLDSQFATKKQREAANEKLREAISLAENFNKRLKSAKNSASSLRLGLADMQRRLKELAGQKITLDPVIFPIKLAYTKEEEKRIADALNSSFQAADISVFSQRLGATLNRDLFKGVSEGLAMGFASRLFLANFEELGKALSAAILKGGTEGQQEVNVILDKLKAFALTIETGPAKQQLQEAFQAIRKVQNAVTQATQGFVNMTNTAKSGVGDLNNDLARLVTLLHTSDQSQSQFIRTIIKLREGKGIVKGIALSVDNVSQRLQIATEFFNRLRLGGGGSNVLIEETKKLISYLVKMQMAQQKASNTGVNINTQKANNQLDTTLNKVRQVQQAAQNVRVTQSQVAQTAVVDQPAQVERAFKQIKINLEPQVDYTQIDLFKQSLATPFQAKVVFSSEDFETVRTRAREIVNILNEETTLKDSLEEARLEAERLKTVTEQIITTLGSANMSITSGDVDTSSNNTFTFEFGDISLTVTGEAFEGITEDDLDALREEFRQRVDQTLEDQIIPLLERVNRESV